MYDGIDALQAFRHRGSVGEIAASEPYSARKAATLLPDREVVKYDDLVGAVGRQMLYEINTYEAGAARYKYAHAGTSRMKHFSGSCVAIVITTSRYKESLNGRNCLRTSWRFP